MSDEIAQGEVLSCLLDINADALQGKDWQRIADLMRRTGCSFEAFDSWVSTSGSPRYSGPDPLRFIWDHSAYAEADRLTIEELKRMAAGWAAHGEDDQKAVQDALYRQTLRKVNAHFSGDVLKSLLAGDDMQRTVPTGLETLDKALGGGLRPGLTVLGAFSSLGKTSLCVQIADRIAASGRAVVFCSIEQTPRELVAKSLARIARKITGRTSFWASDLYSYDARASWKPDGRQVADLKAAADEYRRTIAPYLIYCGGTGQPSVDDIRATAANICEHMGEGAQAPVIIIDYLQLLAPYDEHDSDKKTMDKHVKNLRQLANTLNTIVLCISSISRAAYSEPIEMSSFKESGGVEYGADVAIGLQPLGMKERCKKEKAEEIIDTEKKKRNRDLELKILKNRGFSMPHSTISVYFDGDTQSMLDRGWAEDTASADDDDEEAYCC